MATPEPSILTVFSARPDGATSIAVGLAAARSRTARVLLIDLHDQMPEVGPLLDVQDSPNVQELSVVSRLAPVSASDLEASVQWRDGVGVLAGTWPPIAVGSEITNAFIDSLMATALARFDQVIVDLGRPQPNLAASLADGVLVWVVAPSPLGMAALDRTVLGLETRGCRWIPSAQVVLNRVDERSWRDVERFIDLEYRMRVVARVPLAEGCWRGLEQTHSLAPFCTPVADRRRFERAHGGDAWRSREALERLAAALMPTRPAVPTALEV